MHFEHIGLHLQTDILSYALAMQSLFLKTLLFINLKLIGEESLQPILKTHCSPHNGTTDITDTCQTAFMGVISP